VDPDKAERVAASLEGHFALAEETALTRTLTLAPREAATLVGMGPSAWHTTPVDLPGPVTVTASVRLGVYVERSTSSHPAGGS
jgi:23S rRNA (guanine745-N1)-methyltransferase